MRRWWGRRRGRERWGHQGWCLLALALSAGGSVGCRDVVGAAALAPGTQSPITYNTPEGALAMYRAVKARGSVALAKAILADGVLTDELLAATVGTSPASIGATGDPVDERIIPEGEANDLSDKLYSTLHELRLDARQAIGLLEHYAPRTSPALRGEGYALLGYAELALGELYCSGVPLSTFDFEADFTYKPSSTTQEVLEHAVALEDTALSLSSDSARTLNLARVLKGRALLQLGRYPEAAQAVAAVPDTFRYEVPVFFDFSGFPVFGGFTVADTEGTNGLPFISGADPRVLVTPAGANAFGRRLFTPTQYPVRVLAPAMLASGVEARLIEAEAALPVHGHPDDGQWLTLLNTLRTSGTPVPLAADTIADTLGITGCGPDAEHWCTDDGVTKGTFQVPAGYTLDPTLSFTIQPVGAELASACYNYSYYTSCYNASGSTQVRVYTRPAGVLWLAGTGGVEGLPPLADPGSDSARVSLLFAERAYWLFLTGHRQGDLRRLVRAVSEGGYGRRQDRVYPTGSYYGGRGAYGGDVTLPIPEEERANPLFHGCLNREA